MDTLLSATRPVALRRERSAAEHVPYTSHVSESVIKTSFGDYIQAFRLGGASFESADDEQLNGWHERLNVLWRNVASPHVAIWTHLIRRPERPTLTPSGGGDFARLLKTRYLERLAGETLMVNDLYIALCYRPAAGVASGVISRLLTRSRMAPAQGELDDALDSCAKLAQLLRASLARYEPEPLGTYCWRETWCSSLLEYLAFLINGEWRRVPLPAGPLRHALVTSRLLFGTEAIEYRMAASTRVGAMLAIAQVSSTYGSGEAQTIVENCGNTLILRCSGSEHGGTSQFASRLIGEREVTRITISRSRRMTELFGSTTQTEHPGVEAAVMGSEIEQLPDLGGYLKLASSPGWQRVHLRTPSPQLRMEPRLPTATILRFPRVSPASPALAPTAMPLDQQPTAAHDGFELE